MRQLLELHDGTRVTENVCEMLLNPVLRLPGQSCSTEPSFFEFRVWTRSLWKTLLGRASVNGGWLAQRFK